MKKNIAIVGMSCRFPGADSYQRFWQNLIEGKNAIRETQRWNHQQFYSPEFDQPNRTISKWYGQLDDIDLFDHLFFKISPREARNMDPQQRLLLEETWHCLEDAGVTPGVLQKQRTGVYVGVMGSDYRHVTIDPEIPTDSYAALGSFEGISANRISFLLGLRGPSMSIDTACASSMVALHKAHYGLQSGECAFALAAGVCLQIHPWKHLSFSKARMLSPDGQCKTFDKDANGYVPGEGVAVVLLQPLEEAVAEGRFIHAVLEGSAIGHGGSAPSITAPGVEAQCDVVLGALENAQISADTISYVEAHGTGTSLGDPVEIEALTKAYRQHTERRGYCKIGSVKTNIGHLEATAGLAGVIKVVLMMRFKQIPASLNIRQLNPIINFSDSPFEVAREKCDWDGGRPLRAGVSSFGFGGVNAHTILREYQGPVSTENERDQGGLFLLAAKTRAALGDLITRWRTFTESADFEAGALSDMLATLTAGRLHFCCRFGIRVASKQALRQGLSATSLDTAQPAVPDSWFLHGANPVWRGFPEGVTAAHFEPHLARCREVLAAMGPDLADTFLTTKWPYERQPLFALLLGYVQSRALCDLGFEPAAVSGEGSGQWLAWVVSGLISLEDAAAVLAGIKDFPELALRRPRLPYWDSAAGQMVKPYHFDPNYLTELKANLQVDEAALAYQVKTANSLITNQYTFKKLLEEWAPYLAATGFDLQRMLDLESSGATSPASERLLLLVILQTSLLKLNRKWNLTPSWKVSGAALLELNQLVQDGVFTMPNLITFLLETEPDLCAAAELLNQRQERISDPNLYPLLISSGNASPELNADWLGNLLAPFAPGQHGGSWGHLVIGRSSQVPQESVVTGSLLDQETLEHDLLALWLRGVSLNGALLAPPDYLSVPLPVYPFQGRSFWIGGKPSEDGTTSEQGSMQPAGEPAEEEAYLYHPVWREQALPEGGRDPKRHALLFSSNHDGRLLREMRRRYLSLTLVEDAVTFAIEASGHVAVRAEVADDYKDLLTAIHRGHDLSKGLEIVFDAGFHQGSDNALRCLFYLFKALQAAALTAHIVVVSRAAQVVVAGDNALGYRNACLCGFAATVNEESSRIGMTVVDLESDVSLPSRLLDVGAVPETVCALRGDRFFVRYMMENQVERIAGPVWKATGTYVIAGGAGGLGYLLAKDIAGTFGTHLALVGRSPEGEDIAARVRELNDLGAHAAYFSADITESKEMEAALKKIREKFGPIRGVINAAGILRDQLLAEKTWESFTQVLAPKLQGTEILDYLTRGEPLDFFMTFSSVVSLLGNAGQADYAAANAYLDGFAHHRAQQGLPGKTLNINWTLWRGGGMGVEPSVLARFEKKAGLLSNRAGIEAFHRALGCDHVQLAVTGRNGVFQAPAARPKAPAIGREVRADKYYLPALLALSAEVLDIPPAELSPFTDLRDYGLDSLALGDFSEKIQASLGLDFNAALLFEYPTLDGLATYFDAFAPKQEAPLEPVAIPVPIAGPAAPPEEPPAEMVPSFARTQNARADNAIAVVGMSGRFPGADNPLMFWDNLIAGRDMITEVPADRWDWQAVHGDPKGGHNLTRARWGGFLADIRGFDAAFFNIPPKLAGRMDPQQRMLLEEVWLALENANIRPSDLAGSDTGVWVGVSNDDYMERMVARDIRMDAHTTTGTYSSMIPNRISFFLDLHGPSVATNTACSSSLVAVHQAARAIVDGDCTTAIAAGVNALISPRLFFSLSHAGMLAADGRCKTFDAAADGYVRGEGAGVVVLQPLVQALAENRVIHGIVAASGTNHGGFANSLTAPNPNAQAELVERVIKRSGFEPNTITYIETHGTGTSLGDPIEINGLKRAFANLYAQAGLPDPVAPHCALGALKTAVGHLESAAGIAGMIKVLLAMAHGRLPGNLHQKKPNPMIQLEGSPFELLEKARPWQSSLGLPLRAGVSSFGFGGANAHVVLESFQQSALDQIGRPGPYLVVLSARDSRGLRAGAKNLYTYLQRRPGLDLARIAFSLQTGRDAMVRRLSFVCTHMADLLGQMAAYDAGKAGAYLEDSVEPGFFDRLLGSSAGELFLERLIDARDLDRLAQLWVKGARIPWERLYRVPPPFVNLPGYAFAKTPHWFEETAAPLAVPEVRANQQKPGPAPDPSGPVRAVTGLHPLIDETDHREGETGFGKRFRGEAFYLNDHRVGADAVLPGVAYLEMARAAAETAQKQKVSMITSVFWVRPLLPGPDGVSARVVLTPSDKSMAYEVSSCALDGELQIHAGGQLWFDGADGRPAPLALDAIARRCPQRMGGETCYETFRARNLNYGPSFRPIQYVAMGASESLAKLVLPRVAQAEHALYQLHPALMDGALQSLIGLLGRVDGSSTWLPFALDKVCIYGPLPQELFVHAQAVAGSSAAMPVFNLQLADGAGTVLVTIEQFCLRALQAPTERDTPAASQQPVTGSAVGEASGLDAVLCELVAELLGLPLDAVDTTTEMRDFGFDSITIAELAGRLEKRFEINLSPALLFDHPTIGGLALFLEPMLAPAGRPDQAPPSPTGLDSAALEAELCAMVSELLGLPLEALDAVTEMRDYGFDSITITELATHIDARLGISLSPAVLFDYPTIADLAQYLKPLAPSRPSTQAVDTTPLAAQLDAVAPTSQMPQAGAPLTGLGAGGRPNSNKMAVIGMAAVMPGAEDKESFWRNLAADQVHIREIPADRWDWRAVYGEPGEDGNRTHIRWGGFMNRIDCFDAPFFGYSDLEAGLMDPQQRIFLETAWKTVEDAGYRPSQLSGSSTGVFTGVATSDYTDVLRDVDIEAHTATGWSHAILPNRISYLWNLRGPSEPVDTACSSSLVALHRAVRAIESGECEQALVGGVNVLASPRLFIAFSKAGMLSADGRCRVFDRGANGYVRGEGAAAILIKPLARAEADGDFIRGVILGSAVNHGGLANSLTAPNAPAQTEVIVKAHQQAGCDPRTLGYVEAHGTGTGLGDPIEINGLARAMETLFQQWGLEPPASPHCLVGSVKANIGHLETAAGIAGVVKVLLAMAHKTLPGNPHLVEINPHIDLGHHLDLVRKSRDWQAFRDGDGRALPRRAGVSSFGFGGVNAHVVLEEYQVRSLPDAPSGERRAFVLSARDPSRLKQHAQQMIAFLQQNRVSFDALIATLQHGREAMVSRLALPARDQDEVVAALADFVAGRPHGALFLGEASRGVAASAGGDVVARCQAWVQGAEVPWKPLKQRIPLPGYPFAPLRYWATDGAVSLPPDTRESGVKPTFAPVVEPGLPETSHDQTLYFRRAWVPTELENNVSNGPVLVFCEDPAIAAQLPSGLQATLVLPAEHFEKTAGGTVHMDWRKAAHLKALFQAYRETRQIQLLFLLQRSNQAAEQDLLGFFHVFQVLGDVLPTTRARLHCVVAAQAGNADPHHGALGSFFQTAASENPLHEPKLFQWEGGPFKPELFAFNGGHGHFRYFDGRWSRHHLGPLQPAAVAVDPPLSQGLVCLITGGGGGLGKILARHLARVRGARLMLIGRAAPTEEHAAFLREIEALGGKAQYCRADVTNPGEMKEAVARTRHTFGPIQAVIHAAGLIRDGLLMNKTEADFTSVLAPKVIGTRVLDEVTRAEPLEAFVLFSSLAAPIGNPGQSDYATANSFMDFYAAARTRKGGAGKSVSVNWPLWREGGMWIEPGPLRRFTERTGLVPMPTTLGLDAFRVALTNPGASLLPVVGDGAKIKAFLLPHTAVVEADYPAQQSRPEQTEQPQAQVPAASLASQTQAYLVDLFAAALKIDRDRIKTDEPFSEFGVDSFLTLKIITRLEKDFGTLPKSILFEHGRIDQLSGYLSASHRQTLEQLFPAPLAPPVAPQDPAQTNTPPMEDRVQDYLLDLFAAALKLERHRIQPNQPYSELGVDSFLTLKMITRLEKDFGVLPKSILFEHGRITLLRDYLLAEHGERLNSLFPQAEPEVVAVLAQPQVPVQTESKPRKSERERLALLQAHGYNPMKLPPEAVDHDLKTDSWAQLRMPFIAQRLADLEGLTTHPSLEEALRAYFPFAHILLAPSGREAEGLFYGNLNPAGRDIPQNMLFPSAIFHQIGNDLNPLEMPNPAALFPAGGERFRGDMDLTDLAAKLAGDPAAVAMINVELCNNASGGYPVSMAQLDAVKKLARQYKVPLVLDATRILENAGFIGRYEAGWIGTPQARIVAEICARADYLTASLAKDFCFDGGGVVATNDKALFERMKAAQTETLQRQPLLARALADRPFIEAAVNTRMAAAGILGDVLAEAGVPVSRPAGGHCVLIDVSRLAGIPDAYPLQSLLAALYLFTGMRAGIHNAGMRKGTALNHCIRLAVPLGLERAEAREIGEKVAAFFASGSVITPLDMVKREAGPGGFANATFAPQPGPLPEREQAVEPAKEGFAIVGIAGRYPKADDLDTFWENMNAGADCISDGPAGRPSFRPAIDGQGQNIPAWGGFIDDVACFDAFFFNISPREAENMDPQERLFLETGWSAMEDAGYEPETLTSRRLGVYVGAVWSAYQVIGALETEKGNIQSPNSFHWSIANRLSYSLNLSGPSLTLDTACSSSLTAVHLACKAIADGEIDGAFAGGVNLDLHPSKRLITGAGGTLSPDGRCFTFGARANGYVAGEGVGAIFIKSLERALADGDPIHALIRACAANHGGRASGFVVPNPAAQASLIGEAMAQAGIDARTITYMEAHGTGTRLGDPVEIDGLTRAFRAHTEDRGFCAIGSVKTNIGHLEAAAGIAGITKLVLQLGHGRLVPSLHASPGNPFINFPDSPFFVQTEAGAWPRTRWQGQWQPRRAGLSSFGAGGSNVHLILEEYVAPPRKPAGGPQLVVLSALSGKQLARYAARLSAWLRKNPSAPLADLAFTLRQGRVALEYRWATVVGHIEDLIDQLAAFEAGTPSSYHQGRRDRNQRPRPIAGLDLKTLARLWVSGEVTDLKELDQPGQGRRVSLPTYPFEKRRFWIETSRSAPTRPEKPGEDTVADVHPLLDARLPGKHHFLKRFDAQQFVFRDHIVAGAPTLPGVGYLEMAFALARRGGFQGPVRLENHVWASPINPDCAPEIHIELEGEAYKIYTCPAEGKKVHAQGRMGRHTPERAEPTDIPALLAGLDRHVDAAETYRILGERGLNYGDALKAVRWCKFRENRQLTRLELPASLVPEFSSFHLHPAIMDGAVQSVVGLLEADGESCAYLPFVLGALEVHRPLVPNCYALIVRGKDGAGGSVKSFDVRILDESGNLLVHMRDFSLKALVVDGGPPYYFHEDPQPLALEEEPQLEAGPLLLLDTDQTLFGLCPADTVLVLPGAGFKREKANVFTINVAEAGDYVTLFETLAGTAQPPQRILHLWSRDPEAPMAHSQRHGLWSLFHLLRALPREQSRLQLMVGYAAAARRQRPEMAALLAFLRTAALEIPGFSGKLLSWSGRLSGQTLLAESSHGGSDEVHRDGDLRLVTTIKPFSVTAPTEEPVGQPGAVYLITGGAGGLGLVFARMLAQSPGVTLVLAGRSPLKPPALEAVAQLEGLGAVVQYVQADMGRREAVTALVEGVRKRFGALNGVIHAAGVLRDSLIVNKRPEHMAQVLAAKVDGTRFLDEAIGADALDFFALFSSLAAVPGNRGQSDYAYANRFMDAFAQKREGERAAGRRQGKTISLNWPLWRHGGMGVDEAMEKLLATTAGMVPLETADGLAAFRYSLSAPYASLMVVDGDRARIDLTLGLTKAKPKTTRTTAPTEGFDRGAVAEDLKRGMSQILKVDVADISGDTDLGRFGFDSLSFTDFTNYINETFRLDLTPVIFFEYETLDELIAYLIEDHGEALGRFRKAAVAAAPAPEQIQAALAGAPAPEQYRAAPVATSQPGGAGQPMAIVGMAGVMPGSENLDVFWEHLINGHDLVGEIPPDRWDWRALYGDPLRETHKTNIKWGAFMPEIDRFDASFFGISPREAVLMDPQQRIFLETVWKTMEDAGYSRAALANTATGLFVGTGGNDYHDLLVKHDVEVGPHSATGMMHSVLVNRVSYILGLRGPSEPVETACSSSLVALHRAVAAIERGDCCQALVGGINLIANPDLYIGLAKASMLCEDGRCKTFDSRANGYVRGEGIGAVFVKPLAQAEADGDSIYALLRGTATNHGGHANSLTSPNLNAQAEVLTAAYERAAVDPTSVGYIEAHGTGTALGDPIEINGLKKAFRELYKKWGKAAPEKAHCLIGSVKTNIGHLELASGMAGLFKVLLSLKHKTIPASLHMRDLNPYIKLAGSPFALVDGATPWRALSDDLGRVLPRRAGVSSFGFGGVNAHVVLEEYVDTPSPHPEGEGVFVLSGKNEERLHAYARNMRTYLERLSGQGGQAARERAATLVGRHLSEILHVPAEEIQADESLADQGLDLMAWTTLSEVLAADHGLQLDGAIRRDQTTMDDLTTLLAQAPAAGGGPSLRDLVFTSQVGRDAFEVRLAMVVTDLVDLGNKLDVFLEGGTVAGLYKGTAGKNPAAPMGRDAHDLARSWVAGAAINWRDTYPEGPGPRRVSMPTYPFARDRYWFKPRETKPSQSSFVHPILGAPTERDGRFHFPLNLDADAFYLADHRVGGGAILPGAVCLELAGAAFAHLLKAPVKGLAQLAWHQVISAADRDLSLEIDLAGGRFTLGAAEDVRASGRLLGGALTEETAVDLAALKRACSREGDAAALYDHYESLGICYGDSFRCIRHIGVGVDEALVYLERPSGLPGTPDFELPPNLLDGVFHAAGAVGEPGGRLHVPFALGRVQFHKRLQAPCYVHVRQEPDSGEGVKRFRITAVNERGEILARFHDFAVRPLGPTVAAGRAAHPLLDEVEAPASAAPRHPLFDELLEVDDEVMSTHPLFD